MTIANLSCGHYAGYSWMLPCSQTRLSSPFGFRKHPISGTRKHHNGIDIPAATGTPIYATRAGKIILRQYDSSAGNFIKIKHDKNDADPTSHTYTSVYMHMVRFEDSVKLNDRVEQGQCIGYVGSTGGSTGPHLHFGIWDDDKEYDKDSRRWVDPVLYIFGNEDPSQSYECVEKEIPTYDDWEPLFNHTYTSPKFEGSVESLHNRRGYILKDYCAPLLCGNKINHLISNGYSCIGLNSSNIQIINRQNTVPQTSEREWLSKYDGVNPYKVINNNCVLPGNNSYAWGRVYKAFSNYGYNKSPLNLCTNIKEDWFDYNKRNNIYEYGNIPRIGAIMVWSYKNYENNDDGIEASCVAFVEEVFGSEIVCVSMMKHNPAGGYKQISIEDAFIYKRITNYRNNWDMDKAVYKFKGFIYPIPFNILYGNIEDSTDIKIACDSEYSPIHSLTFAIKNLKHHSKIKVVYDVEIITPMESNSDITSVNLADYCNINITMSQQVVNCTQQDCTYDWSKSILPSKNSSNENNTLYIGNPFPKGVVLLNKNSTYNVKRDTNFDTYTSTLLCKNISETFDLRKYTDGGNIINIFDENDGNIQYFEKELPTYITFTVRSLGNEEFKSKVTIKIKNIILYK